MKLVDVKPSIFIDFNKENIKEGPKFKAGNHVKISKCISIFAKCYVPNWSEEVFVTKKVKNNVLCTYVIGNLNDEEIFQIFMKKNCKIQIKKVRVENVIKRNGNKLYFKWKGYDSSFNSWINKKDI